MSEPASLLHWLWLRCFCRVAGWLVVQVERQAVES